MNHAEHTRFGNLLNELLQDRGIRVYELAKNLNIQRTNVYKMLTGERLPGDLNIVRKICQVLLLSPNESAQLIQAWRIDAMGETAYERRSAVVSFFNTFGKELNGKELFPYAEEPQPQIKIPSRPSTRPLMGVYQVEQAIRDLCYLEASRPSGCIRLFVQPDSPFLISILADIGQRYPRLQIDHLFCLENTQKEKNGVYNFNTLRIMLPVILAGGQYHLRCYYDSLSCLRTAAVFQPFFILTSDSILTFSFDYLYGTIQTNAGIRSMYELFYNNLFEQCTDMLKIDSRLPDILKTVCDNYVVNDKSCLVMSQPCLIQYISREMADTYLKPSLISEEVRGYLDAYFEKIAAIYSNQSETCYFTREGIENFLNTGILDEIPDYIYTPLSVSDRKAVIRKLYHSCQSSPGQIRLLKNNHMTIAPRFMCNQIDDYVILTVNKASGTYYSLFILEPSIVFVLKDFFGFLAESDWLESDQTCLAFLKEKAT